MPANTVYGDLPLFAQRGVASALTDPDAYARAVRVPDYDVCERRSGGQGGSAAANERSAPTKEQQRQAVLAAVLRAGRDGVTLRELAARWGVPMHTISGRFSELKDLGLIARSLGLDGKPALRDGCGVWLDARIAEAEKLSRMEVVGA